MKAVLVVSFGTSIQEARIKNIESLERQIGEAFPHHVMFRAFTSEKIRKKLKRTEGFCIHSLGEALESMREQGVTDLVIQPTHMIPGFEHDKIMDELRACRDFFREIRVGRVLLSEEVDRREAAKAILSELPDLRAHQACVLLGHGTEHACRGIYQQMEQVFRNLGHSHIYIGTVEAHPGVEDVTERLKRDGITDVILLPFMLVAGDHAVNDMAGESGESWKSCMEAAGLNTECILKGLGEYDGIRKIYVRHAREAKSLGGKES